ncbi:MAG TPA: GNAT family protein [Spirillospora sp.]|jgi:ribosomal-protein-serine acetyltransferase|nr:GNAT family protein [Spirillospora sp.]
MFQLDINADLDLRLLTEAHSQILFDLIERNRMYLRAWLPWVDSTRTLEDVRRMLRFGLRQHARSSGMNAGIWHRNQLVGVVSYNYIDVPRGITEIGYWLDEAHQGYGIMTAACRSMVTYAFDWLALTRVEIRCAVHNTRSRAIPERLGFVDQGIAPQLDWTADHYVETVVYSMTAADWQLQEGEALDGSENRRRWQF